MLGIVGMHQLSVGHDVATSQTGHHEHLETAGHVDAAPHSHDSGNVMTATLADLSLSAGHAFGGGGGAVGDDCATCGDHEMALGSCLLALTLLVLSWLLLPPRLRHLPPFLQPRAAPALVRPAYVRLVPALSLTELSLRRT
jgi:hypothetical protein